MFGGWRAQWACPHHRGFSSHINMTLTPARMNTHTLNTRPSKYVRQKLTELKAEVENSTMANVTENSYLENYNQE